MRWRGWALAAVVALLATTWVWWLLPKPVSVAAPYDSAAASRGKDVIPVEGRPPEGAPSRAVRGTVRDAAGAPIVGAEIHLAAARVDPLSERRCEVCLGPIVGAVTHEGVEVLRGLLEAGEGSPVSAKTVRSDGFGNFLFEAVPAQALTIWGSASGFGPAVLDGVVASAPVDLVLPEARELSGRVVDPDGRGFQGARVWSVSHRHGLAISRLSGPDGRFSFEGLGEGPFHVLASAMGMLTASKPVMSADDVPPILSLRTAHTLTVRVLQEGRPAAATVELSALSVDLKRILEVDASGVGTFELLESRVVQIHARTESHVSEQKVLTLSGGENAVELSLQKGGRLWVTTSVEGEDVHESASKERLGIGEEQRWFTVGETVEFGPLAPGERQLVGDFYQFEPVRLPFEIGTEDQYVHLELRRLPTIRGRVVDQKGRPVAGARLATSEFHGQGISEATGEFVVPLVSAGEMTVEAHHPVLGWGQQAVTAPASDVELVLDPGTSVHVRVELDGRPFEGARVTVDSTPTVSGFGEGGVTETQRPHLFGSDERSGLDGIVTVRGLPSGVYTLHAHHGGTLRSQTTEVEVTEGVERFITARLKRLPSVSGFVVDDRGRPLSGATVQALNHKTLTNGVGHFSFSGLEPGEVLRLRAHHPEFVSGKSVEVEAGTPEPVRLVAVPRPRFRGTVVSEDGSTLTAFVLEGRRLSHPSGRFEVSADWAPHEGEQIYSLVFSAPGHQLSTVDAPFGTEELGTITLKRFAVLKGRVVDRAGRGVQGAEVSSLVAKAHSGPDGRFQIEVETMDPKVWLSATKDGLVAKGEVPHASGEVTLVLQPETQQTW